MDEQPEFVHGHRRTEATQCGVAVSNEAREKTLRTGDSQDSAHGIDTLNEHDGFGVRVCGFAPSDGGGAIHGEVVNPGEILVGG